MMDINTKLGKRIRELRKAKGVTQEELAFEAKIDFSYINEIEAGKRNPSVEILNAIAGVLGVTVKDLFEE